MSPYKNPYINAEARGSRSEEEMKELADTDQDDMKVFDDDLEQDKECNEGDLIDADPDDIEILDDDLEQDKEHKEDDLSNKERSSGGKNMFCKEKRV